MLSSLRLQNFRCFESLSIDLGEGSALFIGDNAQGKTSILEAVCVLMRLHSPRSKRGQPMVKFESPGFGVAGDLGDDSLRVTFNKGKTSMLVEAEEVQTQSDYLQSSGLVVWMGNDDVDLVRASGSVRRHYLDFLCSQLDPIYRRSLSRYRKVLKARNLLLKDYPVREAEVAAFDLMLIEYGDYLCAVRGQIVEKLVPRAAAAQVAISGQNEVLALEYVCGSGGDMKTALETTRESERRQRQTLAGPHRDELKILINGMPAADYASEGQQRTVALALKLAQGELLQEIGKKQPMYLLDDIFGELDPARRNALMDYLPGQSQKLITTTNVDWLHDSAISSWKQFTVSDGDVNGEQSKDHAAD